MLLYRRPEAEHKCVCTLKVNVPAVGIECFLCKRVTLETEKGGGGGAKEVSNKQVSCQYMFLPRFGATLLSPSPRFRFGTLRPLDTRADIERVVVVRNGRFSIFAVAKEDLVICSRKFV